MKNLKIVALDQARVPAVVGEYVHRLIERARRRLVAFTLYVEPEMEYKAIHQVKSSRIRLSEQRPVPVPGIKAIAVYLTVYDELCCYNCFLRPPDGTNIVSLLSDLKLAKRALEDELDGRAIKETPGPEDFALKREHLILPGATHRDKQQLLGAWEAQMRENLRVIAEKRHEITGKMTDQKKTERLLRRMCRILQAILIVMNDEDQFEPHLAWKSVLKHIPEEATLSLERFRKIGGAYKFFEATRYGTGAPYFITPKGRQLLRDMASKYPLEKQA